MTDRVIAYVDGFNLYYGLRSKKWRNYYWLNIRALVQQLLKGDQNLLCVKYFTSRVSSTPADPEKSKRQNAFLEALQTLPDFEIHYGHYLANPVKCRNCGASWVVHSEKMTDVNLAMALLIDAFQDAFDVALLMSGDSDLSSLLVSVRRLFPRKRIVVFFPPDRESSRLKNVADAWSRISRNQLAQSQFPDQVRKADGFVLQRPKRWRGRGK